MGKAIIMPENKVPEVEMLVKELRKVQDYCAGQQHGCLECAFWDYWGIECKLGSCPTDWNLDDVGDSAEDTSTSEKGV